jgi:hypothetical protein
MSQENVELVRRLYAATPGLRDAEPVEDPGFVDRLFRDFFDADFVFRLPPEYPEGSRVLKGAKAWAPSSRCCVRRVANGASFRSASSMPEIACWCWST